MEKYVNVILESKYDNWSMPGDYDYEANNYDDRIIGIFDSYEYAKERISDWRKSMMKNDNAICESVYSDKSIVTLEAAEVPEGFEYGESRSDFKYKETYTRRIVVMPLRSREP